MALDDDVSPESSNLGPHGHISRFNMTTMQKKSEFVGWGKWSSMALGSPNLRSFGK
jgi:hypothetical protein